MSTDDSAIAIRKISKVLVANRGEIAVRVIRAAKDAGIASVAVYAEPDAEAPFVHLADEAFALGGQTPADSSLNSEKLLTAAAKSGANAVHPGYGFLSENADFATAVEDAGLIWIGPSPRSIRMLGDKVTARSLARAAHAPMAPGTKEPVTGADEVIEFAAMHGFPVAIKAACGGGGRGLKVAHSVDEIRGLYDSAVREAKAAFGQSECFVERYLERARHVECQVVADMHGNVVVVSTRDCSVQRRFQKLVEEAPAPFVTEEQNRRLCQSAKDICRQAGYYGAGTVEYLVDDAGVMSFLEVNTRLQVEHPVSEEVTGWDVVREQFRIAEGKELSHKEDPVPHGHCIEFRINGEDPGNNFVPSPGMVTKYVMPSGPGVRVDSGIREGNSVSGHFDSLLSKLIVWGDNRSQALARAARALDEYEVEGIPTVIPFFRDIVKDPAFVGDGRSFEIYTKWVEQEWMPRSTVRPWADSSPGAEASIPLQRVVVEIDGRRVEVAMPGDFVVGDRTGSRGAGLCARRPKRRKRRSGGNAVISGDAVISPMQGTIVAVNVVEGQDVEEGQTILILEAMKMENPVKAAKSGTVTGLRVEAGVGVSKGEVLMELRSSGAHRGD